MPLVCQETRHDENPQQQRFTRPNERTNQPTKEIAFQISPGTFNETKYTSRLLAEDVHLLD
jgi:hypothetical protein